MSKYLIFLMIIPLSCMYLTKHMKTKNRFMWKGIALGTVIAPVSFGLIQLSYIPVIGKLLGLVGVIVNLTHGSVGYICLMGCGIIEPNSVITAVHLTMINLCNGILFANIYGLVGHAVDKKLARDKKGPLAVGTPIHTVTP